MLRSFGLVFLDRHGHPSETQRHVEAPLVAFLDYWRRLCGAAELPRRSDFQPGDIPRLLPCLTVVEPLGERFRIRLIGTEVQSRIKRSVRIGMMLDGLTRVCRTVRADQWYRVRAAMRCKARCLSAG
jgi:hypothetical protein